MVSDSSGPPSSSPAPVVGFRGVNRGSVMKYRVGGREYDMKVVHRCATCTSPMRFEIEEQITAGRPYAKIAADLPPEHSLSSRNISEHYYRGHMPLEVSGVRQIVEERAREVGKRIEEGDQELVDGISLLRTVVQKTFEEIAAGRLKPELTDGIRAAKLLSDFGDYDTVGVDQQAYVEAFMVYQEEAAKIMGPEVFAQFGEALASNSTLKALAARYEGGEPGTVQGEVEAEPVEASEPDEEQDAGRVTTRRRPRRTKGSD